jgi:cell division protein FtsQ
MPRFPGRLPVPRLHRPSRRATLAAVLVAALLVPGWFLLRDSPLVSVDKVNVSGLSGPQAAEVRQALTDAAERMTTLDVDQRKLTDAVRQFPIVAGLTVKTHLLHTLDIAVSQHEAVGALANGDKRMAVADDGTILDGTLTKGLPVVPVASPPGGRVLAEPKAQKMVALLAAAPADMRAGIERVNVDEHGLVAQLNQGPELYFGDASGLRAKWIAAERVLADYSSRGATYLDVRVPERPAAGGLEPTAAATAAANLQEAVEASQ